MEEEKKEEEKKEQEIKETKNNETTTVKEKQRQIAYAVIVVIVIIGLVALSFVFNKQTPKNEDTHNHVEEEISQEDLFKEIEEAQQKRQEEAELIVSETGSSLELTLNDFEAKVLKADKPVLIDYYAAWCAPCHTMAPIVESLAKEQDDFYVYKVNVDLQNELALMDDVMSIPTFVVYKDGKKTNSTIGVVSKEKLVQLVNQDRTN